MPIKQEKIIMFYFEIACSSLSTRSDVSSISRYIWILLGYVSVASLEVMSLIFAMMTASMAASFSCSPPTMTLILRSGTVIWVCFTGSMDCDDIAGLVSTGTASCVCSRCSSSRFESHTAQTILP